MDEEPRLFRPQPRRPFKPTLDTSTGQSSSQQTDFASQLESRLQQSRNVNANNGDTTPSRTKSFLNLTGSTLFGIYSDTASFNEQSESATPWGTGAETPARRQSEYFIPSPRMTEMDVVREEAKPKSFRRSVVETALRILALFVVGAAYGVIVSQLHEHGQFQFALVRLDSASWQIWRYMVGWGISGTVLGMFLPWVDSKWGSNEFIKTTERKRRDSARQLEEEIIKEGGELSQVVRSIGVFVGIAFAIRKLPWRSTLQVSLTLSLVNPFLWYIFDRTRPGFAVSFLFAIAGTGTLLSLNSDFVPTPALVSNNQTFLNSSIQTPPQEDIIPGVLSYESVGVATWVSSVLFCSCVCFGNIGRLLAGRR